MQAGNKMKITDQSPPMTSSLPFNNESAFDRFYYHHALTERRDDLRTHEQAERNEMDADLWQIYGWSSSQPQP